MENFLYSLNATLPIFLIMVLGKVLFRLKIINEEFTKSADKYVFYVALPALVFKDLTENNIRESFDLKYVLYCFFVTLFVILILWFLTEKFMKNEAEKGAFIQASYRSSAAILGLAFIDNMYDSAGMAPLMIIGAVPLFNIFAVIILTIKGDNGEHPDVKHTIVNIFKNPILLGILFALPFWIFISRHLSTKEFRIWLPPLLRWHCFPSEPGLKEKRQSRKYVLPCLPVLLN